MGVCRVERWIFGYIADNANKGILFYRASTTVSLFFFRTHYRPTPFLVSSATFPSIRTPNRGKAVGRAAAVTTNPRNRLRAMDLNVSDVLMMLHDYEPSRAKLWEMVRRYDPVQVAALLYLLENVRPEPKKIPITLPDDALIELAGARPFDRDAFMRLELQASLRTDRAAAPPTHLFASPRYVRALRAARPRSPGDANVFDLLERLRSQPAAAAGTAEDNDNDNDEALRQPYLLIVAHNLSTPLYQRFLTNVVNMLFPDDMQLDRAHLLPDQLVAIRYLRYHRQLSLQRSLCATDSRRFRYVMLPRPRRVYRRPRSGAMDSEYGPREFVYQSLYQGVHAVMDQEFDTSLSVRVFNRYGELQRSILPTLRLATSCTFEAVVVPVDRCGWSRSWRYWQYREGYRIYVCDVFRYGDNVLATLPFTERLRYARRLCAENGDALTMARTSTRWSEMLPERVYNGCGSGGDSLGKRSANGATKRTANGATKRSADGATKACHEQELNDNDDLFPPIVGVIARDGNARFSPFYGTGDDGVGAEPLNAQTFELAASTPLQYRFHVRAVYDVLDDRLLRVHGEHRDAAIGDLRTERLFYDLEMADQRSVWLAYGHTDDAYFLCAYNPGLHQYEHVATIERSPYDTTLEPKYAQERLVVTNAKTRPRGFLYLRVYTDRNGRYIGYETKTSTSRYDVPCDAHLRLPRDTDARPWSPPSRNEDATRTTTTTSTT